MLEWETAKLHIRIDEMEDTTCRYTAWSIGTSTSEKPNIVLHDGVREFSGSGGDNHYDFVNGSYLYRCSIIHVGAVDDPPGRVEVFNDNRLIVSEGLIRDF